MVQLFLAMLGALRIFFRSRGDTALEILALRQQVAVLKRQRPRPPLNSGDRFFWTTLRRFWSRWGDVLVSCNVTQHPTAEWIIQQLREAFPEPCRYRYVIFDRDHKFNAEVLSFLEAAGLEPKRTSAQAPWQNGLAERWIGSCQWEILDHIIALNEGHLRRILQDYVNYHHEDRLHDALEKDTPHRRNVEERPGANATVMSMPRLGGLQHRYTWRHPA